VSRSGNESWRIRLLIVVLGPLVLSSLLGAVHLQRDACKKQPGAGDFQMMKASPCQPMKLDTGVARFGLALPIGTRLVWALCTLFVLSCRLWVWWPLPKITPAEVCTRFLGNPGSNPGVADPGDCRCHFLGVAGYPMGRRGCFGRA